MTAQLVRWPFGQGEIRSLTGLRGCAATLVMMYHFALNLPSGTMPMASFFANGYLWVDLFFILSGFVMGYSQSQAFASGRRAIALGRFLLTRFARIYPLYAVVIVESACSLVLRTPHLDWPGFGRILALNLAMVQAWGLASSLEGAAWSISTEWAAYLLFPLLLMVTVTASRRVACITAALAVLAIVAIAQSPGPFGFPGQARSGPLDVYSPATVAPLLRCVAEFVAGLLTFRLARDLDGPRWQRRAAPVSLVVAVTILFAISHPGWDVAVVILFCLLLVSLAPQKGVVARALGMAVPYRLGQWSYSIYLIHDKFSHPASLLRQLLVGHVPMATLTAAVLTSVAVVACAAVTFYTVERPLRSLLLQRVRRSGTPVPFVSNEVLG